MNVSERDLRSVLDGAAALAEVDDPAVLAPVALAQIRRLIPCDHASYNEIDLVRGGARVVADPGEILTRHGLGEFPRLADQNPLIAHHRLTGDGAPVKFSDFVSRRELHALELHADVYRSIGVNHQLGCSLDLEPAVVGVVVNRERHDFDERDREVMRLLQPHLAAGYRRIHARRVPVDGERLAQLTRREREVASLVAQGMTNAEIAVSLLVSVKTVNTHIEHIYRKLGVHRRAQLVAAMFANPHPR